ncbi:cutinase family protein [Candidatus Saccharibacteria bacterium]|nr:cutinase family protein [Candidatus Saccharibacteria bacterium]
MGFSDTDTTLTTLGAYIGSGEVYKFGESVSAGIAELTRVVNKECPDSKYVIGGYSQGAMVISKSLTTLDPDKIIYAATFGDPKIYLPEGEGIIPAACKNENLSDYRMYVPDCQAYKGMLGAVEPYRPEALAGKVGTWCNKYDIFCSSHLSISDHTAYVAENLYEDAAKVINAKVTTAFNIENHYSSLHDTAIVIDSTSSMQPLYEKYKSEALRLAQETFASSGRVALYSYRDLAEAYNPLNHCSFETCTLEKITKELDRMELKGGGDDPESLLSASLHIMKEQKWRQGATKSLIVLTDAGFHNPDLDGTTLDQVVALSHSIDPVNFYIITTAKNETKYHELAVRTDGRVITETDSFSLLTDYILSRYDSLPRVDERSASEITARPTLTVTNQLTTENTTEITYDTDAESVLIAVNDALLGLTTERQITITGLDFTKENILTLTPITSDQKGESVSINLNSLSRGSFAPDDKPSFFVPRVPNTGQRSVHASPK